jgi:hypothetical protein
MSEKLVGAVHNALVSGLGTEGAEQVAEKVRGWLSGSGAGAKKWLLEMMATWLPRVVVLGDGDADEGAALATELKSRWVERGLITVLQQQNPMTDVRNLIKVVDPAHPALAWVGFSTAEYIDKATKTQDNLEERLGNTQFLQDPDAIIERAISLLGATHWAQIAAGLVALTGRRSSEILASASFAKKTRWSVEFSGQLKRRGLLEGASFEIPTLAEADLVVEALGRLRSQVDCSKMNARQVNQKYGGRVIEAVDEHFTGLVPSPLTTGEMEEPQEGAETDNLYTRLLRSVFGALALHRYCPRHVNDHLFLAQIQGHRKVIDATDEQTRRSYVSTLHYDDYRVVNADGAISKGTWLGETVGKGVEVLEALERFAIPEELGIEGTKRRDAVGQEVKLTAGSDDPVEQMREEPILQVIAEPVPKRKPIAYRVYREDRERLEDIRGRMGLLTQADNLEQVVNLALVALNLAEVLDVEVGKVVEAGLSAQQRIKAQELQVEGFQRQVQQQREHSEHLQKELEDEQRAVAELTERITGLELQLAQAKQQVQPTTIGGADRRVLLTLAQELLALAVGIDEGATQQRLIALATRTLAGIGTTQADSSKALVIDERTAATLSNSEAEDQDAAAVVMEVPTELHEGRKQKTKKPTSTVRASGTSSEATQKIHQAIQRLIDFNDHADAWAQKWHINQSTLARLTGSFRPTIQRVLAELHQQIQEHHQKHQLAPLHNGENHRGQDIRKVFETKELQDGSEG